MLLPGEGETSRTEQSFAYSDDGVGIDRVDAGRATGGV